MSGSATYNGRWAVEPGSAPHTFDTSSERYAFISDSVRRNGSIIDAAGILGTRARRVENTRAGNYSVGGTLVWNPTPIGLDLWLPRILGGSESADAFPTAETLPEFGLLCDREGGLFQYTNCKVARATFRGSAGNPIELALDIVGMAEITGTSYPAISLSTAANGYPYMFYEGALVLEGSSRSFESFELVIDNLIVSKFRNSQTATCLLETGRNVTLKCDVPFTSTEMSALYGQEASEAAASLTFTNGNMSTVATIGRLQIPDRSPIIEGNAEIMLQLEGVGRGIAGGADIAFTNDSTA